jgi:hypothetical protein
MAYTALIRSHLEYASCLLNMASKTHLKKLDTIQNIASRIIVGAPRRAHSDPLQTKLGLDPLGERRASHFLRILRAIRDNSTHPALHGKLITSTDGSITSGLLPRTALGKISLLFMGELLLNNHLYTAGIVAC